MGKGTLTMIGLAVMASTLLTCKRKSSQSKTQNLPAATTTDQLAITELNASDNYNQGKCPGSPDRYYSYISESANGGICTTSTLNFETGGAETFIASQPTESLLRCQALCATVKATKSP